MVCLIRIQHPAIIDSGRRLIASSKEVKYSQILGSGFFKIELSDSDKCLVDTHFLGASHHWHRAKRASVEHPEHLEFHVTRYRAHMRHLVEIVYAKGDFTNAQDPSLRELDERENWNPEVLDMPDSNMFDSMLPEIRYGSGKPHPSDAFLKNWLPNAEKRSRTSSGVVRLAGNG